MLLQHAGGELHNVLFLKCITNISGILTQRLNGILTFYSSEAFTVAFHSFHKSKFGLQNFGSVPWSATLSEASDCQCSVATANGSILFCFFYNLIGSNEPELHMCNSCKHAFPRHNEPTAVGVGTSQ